MGARPHQRGAGDRGSRAARCCRAARLNLRVSTRLHRRLAMEAPQHQTSLNTYALLEQHLTA
ncbi:MAG: toxin-antitoxin system HicB family antitoxin [Acidobacteria bacterium]|nr:toxin-antitoxin system HicB family antitoxin [Acidobacteriota bacterium]